jgi:hypothetical protein
MDARIDKLTSAIGRLRDFNHTQDDLKNVKLALDNIFLDKAKCRNFVYTVNTDKIPFGIVCMPMFTGEDINNFIILGDPVKFTDYEIEIDSKMFDYGLTDEEIACIMLYNIHHLTSTLTPGNVVRENIDAYLTNSGIHIIVRDSVYYQTILAFGLYDALNQVTSCLNLPNDIVSDPFLESVELEDEFRTAIDKLYAQIPGCDNEVTRQPKLVMLEWAIRVYSNIDTERIPAINLMEKLKTLTASNLYINRANAVINSLNRIDTSIYESAQVLTEAKKRGLLASLKYSGLRDLENDIYEFMIRAKNAETEQEVMYALKQINARLALLDDYIRENPDDPELDRWIALKGQYIDIRDKLAKTKIYNKKNYGLFIDYNKLDELDDEED